MCVWRGKKKKEKKESLLSRTLNPFTFTNYMGKHLMIMTTCVKKKIIKGIKTSSPCEEVKVKTCDSCHSRGTLQTSFEAVKRWV